MNEKNRKFWIRVMAIVLVALMCVGSIYTAIAYLLV